MSEKFATRVFSRRRFIGYGAATAVVGLVLQACQQAPAVAPTAQVIEKVVTQVVEVEKQVEVTKLVEQQVEVTKIVEQQVEVTKIVENQVEVVVTATAQPPTALPPANLTIAGAPTEKSWAKALEVIDQPQITWTVTPGAQYNKLKVQFAAGTGPDVFDMDVPSGKFWMAKGVMISLEPYRMVNTQFATDLEGFVPSTITSYTWDGELRGTPFSAETSLGYYNADYLTQMGVAMPAANEYDWNSQLDMFLKLTQGDGANKTWATMVNAHTQSGAAEYIYAAGAKIIEDDGLSTNCASPEMIEAVQWMVDLIRTHGVSVEPDAFTADTGLNFWSAMANWRTVYANSGEWAWAPFRDNMLPDRPFTLGFTEPPMHPKTGKRGAQNHTLCLSIYNRSKYPDSAATVVEAYARKDVQELIAPGWLPARIDAQDAFYVGPGAEQIKPIIEATQQYSEPYPASALEEAAVNMFWTHLNQIFLGQEEVEPGLQAAQKEMTEAIVNAAAGR